MKLNSNSDPLILQGISLRAICTPSQKSMPSFSIPNGCTKLALGGENLGDEGVVELSKALTLAAREGRLKDLRDINMPTTKCGPRGAAELAAFLSDGHVNQVRHLNLYGNAVNEEASPCFCVSVS